MFTIKKKDIKVLKKSKFIPILKKKSAKTEDPEIKSGGHPLPLLVSAIGIGEGCESLPSPLGFSMHEESTDFLATKSRVETSGSRASNLQFLFLSSLSCLFCTGSSLASPSWPKDGPNMPPNFPPPRRKRANCHSSRQSPGLTLMG